MQRKTFFSFLYIFSDIQPGGWAGRWISRSPVYSNQNLSNVQNISFCYLYVDGIPSRSENHALAPSLGSVGQALIDASLDTELVSGFMYSLCSATNGQF